MLEMYLSFCYQLRDLHFQFSYSMNYTIKSIKNFEYENNLERDFSDAQYFDINLFENSSTSYQFQNSIQETLVLFRTPYLKWGNKNIDRVLSKN